MGQATIRIDVEEMDNGSFRASSQEVPGLEATGKTLVETISTAQDMAKRLLAAAVEKNEPLLLKRNALSGKRSRRSRLNLTVTIDAEIDRVAGLMDQSHIITRREEIERCAEEAMQELADGKIRGHTADEVIAQLTSL